MNEKFFEMKKEKQDRMINAALKSFALCGYRHAATDEMVRTAAISKGLLFHYFGSKAGLYHFVYDYSVKYLALELSAVEKRREPDFFELLKSIASAQYKAMLQYPYLPLFLLRCETEQEVEALAQIGSMREKLRERYVQLAQEVPPLSFGETMDKGAFEKVLTYTWNGLLQECIREDGADVRLFLEKIFAYLDLLRSLYESWAAAQPTQTSAESKQEISHIEEAPEAK